MDNNLSIYTQLGMRIKYLRKKKEWSQEDLALEASINKNYLCDLENGKRNPSLMILNEIALALSIPLSELLLGIEELK